MSIDVSKDTKQAVCNGIVAVCIIGFLVVAVLIGGLLLLVFAGQYLWIIAMMILGCFLMLTAALVILCIWKGAFWFAKFIGGSTAFLVGGIGGEEKKEEKTEQKEKTTDTI